MTADEIYAKLKELAPSVAFTASRRLDRDFVWDGAGPDPAEEGFDPYDVDIVANTIVGGELLEGFASLGGCYMLEQEDIDDVHGYLPQMLKEAATELRSQLMCTSAYESYKLTGVIEFLKTEMRERWNAQQAEHAND